MRNFFLPPSPTLGRGRRSRIHLKYEPPGGELGGKIGGAERGEILTEKDGSNERNQEENVRP